MTHFAAWFAKTTVESPLGPIEVFGGDAFGMLFEGNVCLTSTAVVRRDLIARAGATIPIVHGRGYRVLSSPGRRWAVWPS